MKKIILSLTLVGAALVAGGFETMKKCACGSENEEQMRTCIQKNHEVNLAEFKACVAKANTQDEIRACHKDMRPDHKNMKQEHKGQKGMKPCEGGDCPKK